MSNLLRWQEQFAAEQHFRVTQLRKEPMHHGEVHSHDFAEVLYVAHGAFTHQVNGTGQTVRQGNVVLIRPLLDNHCVCDLDAHSVVTLISLRATYLRFIATRYFKSSLSFWGGTDSLPKVLTLNLTQQAAIEAAAQRLSDSPQNRLSADRFLLELVDLLENPPRTEEVAQFPTWLREACQKIQDPRYFVHGAAGIALLANRSKEHVAREMKKCQGRTPTEVVNEARMCYAARQLRDATTSIIDIALDCGFESLSHFYKVFKAKQGVTPRLYRRIHQRPDSLVRDVDTEPRDRARLPSADRRIRRTASEDSKEKSSCDKKGGRARCSVVSVE